MKVLVLILCLLVALGCTQKTTAAQILVKQDDNDIKDVIALAGGLLVGAFGEVTSIEACFDNSRAIFNDFSAAYHELKKKTKEGVEEGLINIGRGLLKLPDAIETCKDVTEIVNTVRTLAVAFSNPSALVVMAGKNIIWHSVSIIREVSNAIKYYDQKNYYEFGRCLGKIMSMVFLKNPFYRPNLRNDGTEFLQGYSYGTSMSTYVDVSACIHSSSEETIHEIKKRVMDISVIQVEKSILNMQEIGMYFVDAIRNCHSEHPDVKLLAEKLEKAFTSDEFRDAALAYITDPLKFKEWSAKLHSDFDKKHYFVLGEDIGDFAAQSMNIHAPAINVSE